MSEKKDLVHGLEDHLNEAIRMNEGRGLKVSYFLMHGDSFRVCIGNVKGVVVNRLYIPRAYGLEIDDNSQDFGKFASDIEDFLLSKGISRIEHLELPDGEQDVGKSFYTKPEESALYDTFKFVFEERDRDARKRKTDNVCS